MFYEESADLQERPRTQNLLTIIRSLEPIPSVLHLACGIYIAQETGILDPIYSFETPSHSPVFEDDFCFLYGNGYATPNPRHPIRDHEIRCTKKGADAAKEVLNFRSLKGIVSGLSSEHIGYLARVISWKVRHTRERPSDSLPENYIAFAMLEPLDNIRPYLEIHQNLLKNG